MRPSTRRLRLQPAGAPFDRLASKSCAPAAGSGRTYVLRVSRAGAGHHAPPATYRSGRPEFRYRMSVLVGAPGAYAENACAPVGATASSQAITAGAAAIRAEVVA